MFSSFRPSLQTCTHRLCLLILLLASWVQRPLIYDGFMMRATQAFCLTHDRQGMIQTLQTVTDGSLPLLKGLYVSHFSFSLTTDPSLSTTTLSAPRQDEEETTNMYRMPANWLRHISIDLGVVLVSLQVLPIDETLDSLFQVCRLDRELELHPPHHRPHLSWHALPEVRVRVRVRVRSLPAETAL